MKYKQEKFLQELMKDYGEWFNDPSRLKQGRMTSDLYPYSRLFSPITINKTKIKNRIVMGPMGNINMADETGRPGEKMIEYFKERARGGAGLITTGLVQVSQKYDPTTTFPDDYTIGPRIEKSRSSYVGWRNLAEAVHTFGSRIFIQLSPGLGRVGAPECVPEKYKLPISASWNPNHYIPMIPCRPLGTRSLKKIVKKTGEVSAVARDLLIDGVYLHGHEGYFLEQMSNPAFNRRMLGRYRHWQRFGMDLIKEIRRRCGGDYPVMYRIDLSLALNATYGERMNSVRALKKFQNERTIPQALDYIKNLISAGVDIIDIDLGCYDNWWLPHPPNAMPPGCFLPVSALVKKYIEDNNIRGNSGEAVPVVAVGKLGYPDLAESALRDNKCDMIMLARPLLADPEWPNKAYAGRVRDILPCIGDQEGCLNEIWGGGHFQCALNPRTGFEYLENREPGKSSKPKRIAVVGAGPAGMMCASTATERGHTVDIYEKRDRAGGALTIGAVPAVKFDVKNYLDWMNNRLAALRKEYDLAVHYNHEAGLDELKDKNYDAVVFATGAKPVTIPVPGIDGAGVIQAIDLLSDPGKIADGSSVVVVGGGEIGMEAAHFCAYEKKCSVTIIEMLKYFLRKSCTANRAYMIHYLEKAGVKLITCARLKAVTASGILIDRDVHPKCPDPYITWTPLIPESLEELVYRPHKPRIAEEEIECDYVVLAAGVRPDDSLYREAVKKNIAGKIYNIGDCFEFGRVFEATKAGYSVGKSL